MVLKDAELDELWKSLGYYRLEIKKNLEAITKTEATMFSMVPDRLIREYQELKHDYEHQHEALEKLQRDYTLRVKGLDERTREMVEAKKSIAELQRQLAQRR